MPKLVQWLKCTHNIPVETRNNRFQCTISPSQYLHVCVQVPRQTPCHQPVLNLSRLKLEVARHKPTPSFNEQLSLESVIFTVTKLTVEQVSFVIQPLILQAREGSHALTAPAPVYQLDQWTSCPSTERSFSAAKQQ